MDWGERVGFLLCSAGLDTTASNWSEGSNGEIESGRCRPDKGRGRSLQTSERAALSSGAPTWPLSPEARASRAGVTGSGARMVQAGAPAQDAREHRRKPTQGAPLAIHLLPRAPHLPTLRRWPPLRGALPLRARGMPAIRRRGARGQGPGGRGLQTSETPAGALR